MRLLLCLIAALIFVGLQPPVTASADAHCTPSADGQVCGIDEGGGDGGSGGTGGGGSTPKYPKCSAMPAGAILLLFGVSPDTIPDIKPDWKMITCEMGDGSLRHAYMERVDPEAIARALLAQMELKPIDMGMVPREGANRMALVGLPVWMWVDDPTRATWGPYSISAGGISMTARATKVVWDMGTGDKVTCDKGTEWTKADGKKKSPTCGYVYDKQGRYEVTATSSWRADWRGYGQSGTFRFALQSDRSLPVGEVQVVVTSGR
ncbi:MAG: hypothetical protein LCH96_14720 [Actinobacteria bacterium]|nr:hypothetical protein [Actinomycetota bacterium]